MQVSLSEDFMVALGKLNGNEIKKASNTIMAIKKDSDAKGWRAPIYIWDSFPEGQIGTVRDTNELLYKKEKEYLT